MNHRYEALLVLNAQGKEDTLREIIDRLESEFQKEGAQLEQVQKWMAPILYVAGPLDSGYYVNFIFSADPESIEGAREIKLDRSVSQITSVSPTRRRNWGKVGKSQIGSL
jgi:ribosomal protein S6